MSRAKSLLIPERVILGETGLLDSLEKLSLPNIVHTNSGMAACSSSPNTPLRGFLDRQKPSSPTYKV